MNVNRRIPELMSPAGHWPQLHAAIEAGADAVYFGLNHFSARAKVGFDIAELRAVMETLHRRGVKGFVTFNTLVFDHEMAAAERAIADIAEAGADAVIVQDFGVARLVRQWAPDLPIHGSTQMSITSAEGVAMAAALGCSRVVLGRELSVKDIRQIAAQTDVELEVFVHGALCVSYSGQCFSSEAWGGRSANRGQCAQACRLSYELVVDGAVRDLGAARYLLSPGDLFALEQIPELCDIGIACFKIEGRYKDADYVALVTHAYRQQIDRALAGTAEPVADATRQELEQVYSRGLGPYFISGTNHQAVVDGRAPRHRGVYVGRVARVGSNSVTVAGELELQRGDGVVFDAADRRSPEIPEQGGFVYDAVPTPAGSELNFEAGRIDFREIQPGDWVWRTASPQTARIAKRFTQAQDPVFTRPLQMKIVVMVGQPLRLEGWEDPERTIVVEGPSKVSPARQSATSNEQISLQLGRLGGTPFHAGQIAIESCGAAFVPVSQLNQLRRDLVERLIQQRLSKSAVAPASAERRWELAARRDFSPARVELRDMNLHMLVRSSEQLPAAIECRPESITLDYLELYGLKQSVQQVQAANIPVRVASPRVLKPAEQKVVHFLLSLDVPLLIRSGGLLYDLHRRTGELPPLIADFSLNAANRETVKLLLDMGVQRISPSHDLNAEQIAGFAAHTDPARFELIVYHHLPIFHMEHCVFCRFLSSGTDNTNCGHPCEKHRVSVRDSSGREHPVMADVGCRNTVFNAQIQSAGRFLERWRMLGFQHYRIEFVHQSPDQVRRAIRSFQGFRDRQIDGGQLDQAWSQTGESGVSQGSLYVSKGYQDLVQLGGPLQKSP